MPSLQPVSVADVIERLGVKVNELLQIPATEDATGNVALLSAVRSANDCVHGYIRTRYALPLERNDASLTLYACHLVQYDLASRRPDIFSEADKTLRMDAIKFLENVRDGKIQLLFPPANRNRDNARAELVTVAGDVSATDYPTASNPSWFNKW